MSRVKVTAYVTSHNYGRFLGEAVDSILAQTLQSWELWIVDDGSSDDTHDIASRYAAADSRISVIKHGKAKGLRASANEVLEMARGQYIIRLDADDYFDESAFLVLSNYLDQHGDVGLVYPNWTYISEDGAFLGIERRKKVGQEAQVLDLPAHGACTMVRRRVLKSVGGYDTQHDSQDGHELWIKVLHRHGVANVSTPLFFYRQHGSSMSRSEQRLLNSRQKIKRTLAEKSEGAVNPRSVAIIPAKNTYDHLPDVVLKPIAGKPLIDYTLDAALASGVFEHIFVYTDDERVVEHCLKVPGVIAQMRDSKLSNVRSTLADVMCSALQKLEDDHDIHSDIVVLLSVHSPLRQPQHIQEAIDTLVLYDVDNVISTYEDIELHFRHGKTGLEPLNPGMVAQLRFERESLFVDNGAVHAFWRELITEDNVYRGKIGHIVMPRELSHQIKEQSDIDIVQTLNSLNFYK